MLLEERFAAPFTLRGYEARPAYDGVPLVLCLPPEVAGTHRARSAVEQIRSALSRNR